MTHLLDKDALVAEINKRIINAPINYIGHQRVWAYNNVKDIINTLEVKEVHLDEHQIADIIQNLFPTDQFIESETLLLSRDEAILFAKHFLELGLKARQG